MFTKCHDRYLLRFQKCMATEVEASSVELYTFIRTFECATRTPEFKK